MSDDIKALRKRAMYDPQSLTQEEWLTILKAATSVPKNDLSDGAIKVTSSNSKQKKKGSWW